MNNPNLPGYHDLNGLVIARSEIARLVPNFDRFERRLPDALMVNQEMRTNGGQIPDVVAHWSESRLYEVVVTLSEVGVLKRYAAMQIGRNAH